MFPIGASNLLTLQQAGTLYLGIDDFIVGDNGGSFDVAVRTSDAAVPEPGTLPSLAAGCAAVLMMSLRRRIHGLT